MTIKQITKYIPWNPNILILLSIFVVVAFFAFIFQSKLTGQPFILSLLNGVLSSTLVILFLELFQELKLRQAYSKLEGEEWEGFNLVGGELHPHKLIEEIVNNKTGIINPIHSISEAKITYLYSNLLEIVVRHKKSYKESNVYRTWKGNMVLSKDGISSGFIFFSYQEDKHEIGFKDVIYCKNGELEYIYLVPRLFSDESGVKYGTEVFRRQIITNKHNERANQNPDSG